MRAEYKQLVTEYIREQNYPAIVELGRDNGARTLRYVQMHIWGDARDPQRWYALEALAALARAYAAEQDEVYRNVIRRAVWAMTDESGNVPWAAPEMMAVVIKACPDAYREFVPILITNGLDSPMCHAGVLWSAGYLGPDFLPDMTPFLPRMETFLLDADSALRGTAVWAFQRLHYAPASAAIRSLAADPGKVWLYADGALQETTVGRIARAYAWDGSESN